MAKRRIASHNSCPDDVPLRAFSSGSSGTTIGNGSLSQGVPNSSTFCAKLRASKTKT